MSPRKSVSPENRKGYEEKKITAFCKNVRRLREEQGLTQPELGARIGAPAPRISEIEKGVFPADPARLVALAQALGCTTDELLGHHPPRKQDEPRRLTDDQDEVLEQIPRLVELLGETYRQCASNPRMAKLLKKHLAPLVKVLEGVRTSA